jgi:hypothetical protein
MKAICVGVLCLTVCAVPALANTTINNFGGYSDYWHPLGNPNTATYGETFTAPTNGDTDLTSFGFFIGSPYASGDIKLGAYIATWTGSDAGTILYSSPETDYTNAGDAFLDFTTGGLDLTSGGSYVMFLSVSQYYGLSSGEADISQGGSIPGGGFVYNNNGGDFSALTSSSWSGPLSPNWAVDLEFTPATPTVPEPSSFLLLVTGLLTTAGALRRKVRC